MESGGEITRLLVGLRKGDEQALQDLFPLLYDELRRIARQRMRQERPGHTLRPTALVHEAFVRLLDQEAIRVEDRSQFFAAASETMRRILVDYARTRKRLKRGGDRVQVPLEDSHAFLTERQADEVLALEDALTRLSKIDQRAFQVVRCRFFGGLTMRETAEALGVSRKTIQRSWSTAQAWLRKEIAQDLHLDETPAGQDTK